MSDIFETLFSQLLSRKAAITNYCCHEMTRLIGQQCNLGSRCQIKMEVARNSSHERVDQCEMGFHFSCYPYTEQSVFFPAITNPFHLSQLMDLLMHLVYFILSSIASFFFANEAPLRPSSSPLLLNFKLKSFPWPPGGCCRSGTFQHKILNMIEIQNLA